MKNTLLIFVFFLLNYFAFAQKPEWILIDFQELIMYDGIRDIFDFDLTNQEIIEISNGDYGAIWLTTQDYKIKYLPDNLIIYSLHDLENPYYFFPHSTFSLSPYSRINKKEIADKLPSNTWVKYDSPENYDYIIKKNEKKIVDEKYFTIYELENYSIPLSSENEISPDELASTLLNIFIEAWGNLQDENGVGSLTKALTDGTNKLAYRENLNSKSLAERCFDFLLDLNKNVWIATGKRLIRFDGSKFFEINIPALTLASDFHNNIWIGTSAYNSLGSLIKFDGCNFTFYNALNSPLPENDGILDLEIDYKGNLWISLKRTGLPDRLDNIKIALYNPNGVKNDAAEFLQYIYWIREPIIKDLLSLYSTKMDIRVNKKEVKPFSKIEIIVNNKVIKLIDSQTEFTENADLNISYYPQKPDKNLFCIYFYDLDNTKIELANYELNYQFNADGYFLGQNKTNPVLDYTRIEYGFFSGHLVGLKIFDSFIRQIAATEEYYIDWIGKPFIFNASGLPNGIYYYYLKENNSGIVDAKKLILFNPRKIISLPH